MWEPTPCKQLLDPLGKILSRFSPGGMLENNLGECPITNRIAVGLKPFGRGGGQF